MKTADIDLRYNELISMIYQGPIQDPPWQSALPCLREIFDAQVVSLVLRPPAEGDAGVILNSIRPDPTNNPQRADSGDPGDWELTAYREEFFALDPFVNLPRDQVISLEDLVPESELELTEYYRQYLLPIDLFRILGVDTQEPGGMLARLRFSRRRQEPLFDTEDKTLLELITPHLARAIHLYSQLSRTTSERDIYSGAVDQLAVATVILDEQGRVTNTNAVADALLLQSGGLSIRGERLHLAGRDIDRELQETIAAILGTQLAEEPAMVRALRIPREEGRADLGLIIRPVPIRQWGEGQSSPRATVFISDPDLRETASQHILSKLFELTPAEANLSILLSRGLSLADISEVQSISPHTARAQLKSVFAKTGASRQAELVRLILKSVASLA
ncbi:MAG: DNA-binding CsgD family transcriptional regulator [Alcanivorax sp.]|jgi:DNA-binding CsgD family transcriptional regulator